MKSLFERAWLDRFLALLPAGGAMLDLGCGSGEPIARYFIAAGYAVTGVDSSPAMIALCRSRFPGQNWIVGDMRTLALGRRFDGILAWDSYFHLRQDDQRRMFAVFGAHAGPKAALMFTSGPRARREHRQLSRRAALSRQPRSGRIPQPARGARLSPWWRRRARMQAWAGARHGSRGAARRQPNAP